ncbi:hypothetical protein A1O7_08084 [Cladophialophora yegresii CBS 114405]|uniref:Uncharacterized protein n=1 Tax=Cladophialophora yegresii CBS 114405 TaxID=1182544 RepID=W9W9C3_9EURO|nr:uncharacterized protein A1O7_08084 [Cladophialophora yegresii CBS 114405]EXJ55159.1 hypothetical protein A1O7_08084 [Cladophialophora yegresii CBS 114405]
MIYQYCLDIRATALFRASKQLYLESLPYLREKFVLGFHIDPRAPRSVIYLVNRHGHPWGENRNIISVESAHEESVYLDFMPVDQFGKIRVRIDAPDPEDPGQLVRCWYQTKRLLTILLPRWRDPDRFPEDEANDIILAPDRVSTRMPSIEVMFHNDDQGRWWHGSTQTAFRWTRSVLCCKVLIPDILELRRLRCPGCADFRYIVDLFQRVRNARSIDIRIECQEHPQVQWLVAKLKQSAVSSTPFGLILDRKGRTASPKNWEFDDAHVLGRENARHIWFDYILECLPGKTATDLDRERYDNWCLGYEEALRRSAFGYSFGTLRHAFGGGFDALKVPGSMFHWVYQRALRKRFWQWADRRTNATDGCTYETYLNRHTALLRNHTEHVKTFFSGKKNVTGDVMLGMLPILGEAPVPISRPTYAQLQSELGMQRQNVYSPQLGKSVKCVLLWARPGCCQRCSPYDPNVGRV